MNFNARVTQKSGSSVSLSVEGGQSGVSGGSINLTLSSPEAANAFTQGQTVSVTVQANQANQAQSKG
jgi:hypothetical protein